MNPQTELVLDKVTAFITRTTTRGIDLLLIAHPHAGNQLPAGTVEENESPRDAVLREVAEETGLRDPRIEKLIAVADDPLGARELIVARTTRVYARPNTSSFAWAELRRGIRVTRERARDGFTQITYTEPDDYPHAHYITYQITGWVPGDVLCARQRRHFFHLTLDRDTPDAWTQFADNHTFRVLWSPLSDLADIVALQNRWVEQFVSSLAA